MLHRSSGFADCREYGNELSGSINKNFLAGWVINSLKKDSATWG
jgi:hypothetical protein